MPELHEIIERKFINEFDLCDYEIETDTGFHDVSKILKTIPYQIYEVSLEGGYSLKCADTHIVFTSDIKEIFVKDLIPGQSFVLTDSGPKKVTSLIIHDEYDNMYDVQVSSDDHRFYSNGILSHNTITTAAFMLWFAIFHPDKTIAILANKAKIAREILDRVIKSLENIPFFLQPGVKVLNKGSVEFGNGSRIFADATSEDAIRGFSVNILYLDEFAHVDNAVKFFESVFPTISSGADSKIIISSTANGLNLYYKLWKDAIDGRNDFVPVEVKLSEIPGRNDEWQRKQIEILGERGFRQEYGNEFLGSSNTLISGYKLQELAWEVPIFRDVETCILEEPKEGHTYVSIIDVSKGVSQDYSTVTTIDMNEFPYKTVHIFRDNTTPPIQLPEIILSIAKKYNNSYILCERNAMGQSVVDTMYFDFEYENIFSTASGGRRGQVLSIGSSQKYLLGVEMTSVVKRIGTATLKAMIESNKIVNFSEEQVLELYNFISKKDSFAADKGKHDDLVMNLVLFAWALNQPYFKEISNQDISAAFRDKPAVEYDTLSFGYSDGTESDTDTREIWNF